VEAVFSIIKYQLHKASIAEDDAFTFLGAKNHSDSLTYSDFCLALQKVNTFSSGKSRPQFSTNADKKILDLHILIGI
jgi:hypothetical protein